MHCAVIGSPINHSLSPDLHRAAYRTLGLNWAYTRHEVAAEGVARFVARLDGDWRGLSVTMPCKAAIVELGVGDEVVRALGVANTVIFDGLPADRDSTRVYNTDVPGAQMVLREVGVRPGSQVLVYGNGATARSIIYALARMGLTEVAVRGRDQAKTAALSSDGENWGIEVVAAENAVNHCDVIISTVPAEVAGEWADLSKVGVVFDVLYDPWPTPLIAFARRRGLQVRTGLDLLAAQAVGQVKLMTGRRIDFAVLRQAAREGIARRSG